MAKSLKLLTALRKIQPRARAHFTLYCERFQAKVFYSLVLPLFFALGLLDFVFHSSLSVTEIIGLRTFAAATAIFLFRTSTVHVSFYFRYFFAFAPLVIVSEYLLIEGQLLFTPYIAGLSILILAGSLFVVTELEGALLMNTLLLLPVFSYLLFNGPTAGSQELNLWGTAALAILTIAAASFNSKKTRQQLLRGFRSYYRLRRELQSQKLEVSTKTQELLKRKTFEKQFSPQIIEQVLKDGKILDGMRRQPIVVLVCDIKSSTARAHHLQPSAYREVVEDVFDVIVAACLKWDIVVDKFTGDGVQAFAGAPVRKSDDVARAIQACNEIQKMVDARQDYFSPRWGGHVEMRFSVCEGEALIGFLGKGTLKSFTGIGEIVSFTHRLCAHAEIGTVLAYSFSRDLSEKDLPPFGFVASVQQVSGLKGFGDKVFDALRLEPWGVMASSVDLGRCEECSTPLVFKENQGAGGLPQVSCPACGTFGDSSEAA